MKTGADKVRMESGKGTMNRDFDEKPYTEDEARVAKYLDAKFGMGGGEDPIGFLIAHDALMIAERKEARQRLFGNRQVDGFSHSTACSIWGDNGRGGTLENFPEPLPCNCGALINWARKQALEALKVPQADGD